MKLLVLLLCAVYVTFAYPDMRLPPGNTTVIYTLDTLYGAHVVALGKDGQLWQKYTEKGGNFTNWLLMPNINQLPNTCKVDADCPQGTHCENQPPKQPPYACSGNPAMQMYDGDPAMAINKDGRLEVFARNAFELDTWHWYQADPSDPLSWVGPRRPSCLCNFPPCSGQTHCGLNNNCDNLGMDCHNPVQEDYWNTQPAFPTSDGNFGMDPKTGALKYFYRGFDGGLFYVAQKTPGSSVKYLPPVSMNTLVE